jgi:hypothetical protein
MRGSDRRGGRERPGDREREVDPVTDKKIEPKAPEAEVGEKNAARVEKKTSRRLNKSNKRVKVSRRVKGK